VALGPDDESVNHDHYLYGWPADTAETPRRHGRAPRTCDAKGSPPLGRGPVLQSVPHARFVVTNSCSRNWRRGCGLAPAPPKPSPPFVISSTAVDTKWCSSIGASSPPRPHAWSAIGTRCSACRISRALRVEWVVRSACDTRLGEIKAGEGVFGLRRAFQVAGARTVIMSLWSVDDEATRLWMRALYRNRLQNI